MKEKVLTLFILFMTFTAFAVLDFYGLIRHNEIFAWEYELKGLDVSNHQGQIDWQKVAGTHQYSFVYIKATEGHDFTDKSFAKNWQEAKKNGFLVGAYHFFSTRSSGKEQANNFISVVPKEEGSLPPVIDIEISLDKDPNQIRKEIIDLITILENHYQKQPILYVRYDTYNAYIKGYFTNYNIWVRDVFKYPTYDRGWSMWQYSNRGRIPGINTYTDINVFNGSKEDLQNLAKTR